MKSYTEAYAESMCAHVVVAVQAEARALIEGIDPTLAAEVGIERTRRSVRKVAPFLNDARVSAVNAEGSRLPHNARGVGAAGSPTLRGAYRAQQRTFQFTNNHATYIDGVRRIMCELERLVASYTSGSCRTRKKLRGPIRAVHNKLQCELSRTL